MDLLEALFREDGSRDAGLAKAGRWTASARIFCDLSPALDVNARCGAHRQDGQTELPSHPNFCGRCLDVELLHDNPGFVDELRTHNADRVGFTRIQTADFV